MESNWPAPSDYLDALQHPGRALYMFEDLRESEIETNHLRKPKGRSGSFAIVYKVTGAKGPVAVKVFRNPEPDRQRRYEALASHLTKVQSPFTVRFDYHSEGIFVSCNGKKGEYFPVLLMEWVKGETFGKWVHERVLAKDTQSLRQVADEWVQLIESLQKMEIAHGDLQHGNIMVVNGHLKLIDYDGMYVPDLLNSDQIESGLPPYQHRERPQQQLGPNLDHFSAWIILISLRALAADPSIYAKYKKRANSSADHENLLFTVDDLHEHNSKQAPIWADLKKSPDPEVREWAATLRECLDQPFERIPPFAMDVFAPLRAAIAIKPPDWDQIAQLSKAQTKLPDDCRDAVMEARKRVDCRKRVAEALDRGDLQAASTAYDPLLLDDWNACRDIVKRVKQGRKHLQILNELAEAAKKIGDGQAFVKRWDACAPELSDVPEAKRYQKLAEEWRERIRVADFYLAILKKPGVTERQIAEAWKLVEKNAPTHPSITTAQQERGRLAQRRVALLVKLSAITDINEEADKQLKATWDADLFDGCTDADAASVRKRHADALQRLDCLRDLRDKIAKADKGEEEEPITTTAAKLPSGYLDEKLKERIRLSRERQILESEMSKALATDSDRAIKAAWEKAKKKLAAHQVPRIAQRCKLAEIRCKLLDDLEAIDEHAALDVQDDAWEKTWKKEFLDECGDAKPHKPRYELAVKRRKAWQELDEALQRGLPGDVRTKAAHPLLAGYPPVKKRESMIAEFVRKADDVDRILNKLKAPGPGQPLSEADLAVLRTSPELFGAEARKQIETLIAKRLSGTLRLSAIDEGYDVEGDGDFINLRWSWPDFALISCCYLDVNSKEHAEAPGPRPLVCSADDHRRAGGKRILPAHGGDTFVTIWPVVNLGWKELLGQPLFIGPIGATSNGDYSYA